MPRYRYFWHPFTGLGLWVHSLHLTDKGRFQASISGNGRLTGHFHQQQIGLFAARCLADLGRNSPVDNGVLHVFPLVRLGGDTECFIDRLDTVGSLPFITVFCPATKSDQLVSSR